MDLNELKLSIDSINLTVQKIHTVSMATDKRVGNLEAQVKLISEGLLQHSIPNAVAPSIHSISKPTITQDLDIETNRIHLISPVRDGNPEIVVSKDEELSNRKCNVMIPDEILYDINMKGNKLMNTNEFAFTDIKSVMQSKFDSSDSMLSELDKVIGNVNNETLKLKHFHDQLKLCLHLEKGSLESIPPYLASNNIISKKPVDYEVPMKDIKDTMYVDKCQLRKQSSNNSSVNQEHTDNKAPETEPQPAPLVGINNLIKDIKETNTYIEASPEQPNAMTHDLGVALSKSMNTKDKQVTSTSSETSQQRSFSASNKSSTMETTRLHVSATQAVNSSSSVADITEVKGHKGACIAKEDKLELVAGKGHQELSMPRFEQASVKEVYKQNATGHDLVTFSVNRSVQMTGLDVTGPDYGAAPVVIKVTDQARKTELSSTDVKVIGGGWAWSLHHVRLPEPLVLYPDRTYMVSVIDTGDNKLTWSVCKGNTNSSVRVDTGPNRGIMVKYQDGDKYTEGTIISLYFTCLQNGVDHSSLQT